MIDNELGNEIEWARSRPTSLAEGDLLHTDPHAWENALTVSEHTFLEEYRARWPGGAFLLNQDPSSGHGHHTKCGSKALMTLISNMGLLWLDRADSGQPNRWLSPTEALISMGLLGSEIGARTVSHVQQQVL